MMITVGRIESAWWQEDGYARLLREPGPDNPVYRDQEEVLAEYGFKLQD